MIAVQDPSSFVHPDRPVGIAVISDAQVAPGVQNLPGETLGMKRPASKVDIFPVRMTMDDDDLNSKLAMDARGYGRARPVGAVQGHFPFFPGPGKID